MTSTTAVTQTPDYQTGTWTIDAAHSDVSFTVRHLMISKVRGHFRSFSGQIVTAEDPAGSSVTATVDLTSLDTNNEQRDEHIRSADFFDVATYSTMSYRSTGVRGDGDSWVVDGDLTLHGVTRPVPLAVEVNGFGRDPFSGATKAGFSATAAINRRDFGIDITLPMDGGGVVVGDKIAITLEIEAILDA
ncbi:MAG: YceI family protein [Egibacteraceae bacterium]